MPGPHALSPFTEKEEVHKNYHGKGAVMAPAFHAGTLVDHLCSAGR